jgi:hypothetical protein
VAESLREVLRRSTNRIESLSTMENRPHRAMLAALPDLPMEQYHQIVERLNRARRVLTERKTQVDAPTKAAEEARAARFERAMKLLDNAALSRARAELKRRMDLLDTVERAVKADPDVRDWLADILRPVH